MIDLQIQTQARCCLDIRHVVSDALVSATRGPLPRQYAIHSKLRASMGMNSWHTASYIQAETWETSLLGPAKQLGSPFVLCRTHEEIRAGTAQLPGWCSGWRESWSDVQLQPCVSHPLDDSSLALTVPALLSSLFAPKTSLYAFTIAQALLPNSQSFSSSHWARVIWEEAPVATSPLAQIGRL